jgi:methyl-coenzyme M reductase alpha subunit
MLYDQIWLGGYMSGGVGFTMYATPAYTNDIVDDFLYWAMTMQKEIRRKWKGKATIETVKDIATEVTLYGLEAYEKYPTTLEDHFGGSQRATVVSIAAGGATALATGHSQAGLSADQPPPKEAHGRLDSMDMTCRIVRCNQRVLDRLRRGLHRRMQRR